MDAQTPTAASQDALVERARAGDRSAFGELVRFHERRVLALFIGLGADRELAEELTQESFVRAWLSIRGLRAAGEFGPWIGGIARNIWKEWAKEAKRRRNRPEPSAPENTELIRRKEVLNQQIFQIVQKLPDPYGELLSLRYFGGRSCQEIAEALGRPLGTVTKQISRAHALVAQEIQALRGFTTLLHFMLPREAPGA